MRTLSICNSSATSQRTSKVYAFLFYGHSANLGYMHDIMSFRTLAKCCCTVLIALICTATVAKACDLEVKHTVKKNLLPRPGDAYFDLFADQLKLGEIRLTVHRRDDAKWRGYTKDDKRVRFVGGVAVAIENLRNKVSGNTSVGFYAENKTFTGKVSIAPESKNHAVGSEIRASNINGKAADVLLRYDDRRLMSDAFEDAVCLYKALPKMLEDADG